MNLASLSIRRPIFITCVVLLTLAVGLLSLFTLGVDLFPDVTFPVVTVTTPYPGAGPSEIETLVTKPLEDEISTLSGIKRLSSQNQEGASVVIAEFTLETDVKYAEQQIRDRVSSTKSKLPTDVKESTIRRIDPSDQPIVQIAVGAPGLSDAQLYDLANERIKPRLEQVNQVGLVEVLGGRKREIHVDMDRKKLRDYEVSIGQVAGRIAGAGEDIPSGKKSLGAKELVYRTLGQFHSVDDVKKLVVNFFNNDVPTRISDLGEVNDSLEDETSRAFLNGGKSLFINAYRQSGSNTIKVADEIKAKVAKINAELADAAKAKGEQPARLDVWRDSSVWIRANVQDVKESILIGAVLAVVVVFFFLVNGRSTIITGLALPNSLIGAFVLMSIAGFTINIMTLLALSLAVGLLIDDAIVVRENIFRHIEMGKKPIQAALEGTSEVQLAVIATTLTVIAVFGPLGFLKGVVGQFFKQFGLTVCFAMAISLFDAITIAPMLSAYFAGAAHKPGQGTSLWARTGGRVLRSFDRFQSWLEDVYGRFLRVVLKHPLATLSLALVAFFITSYPAKYVAKTFLPAQDAGEFAISLDLPPGSSLDAMTELALKVDKIVRDNPAVLLAALNTGAAGNGSSNDPNQANFYVHLKPLEERPGRVNTSQVKDQVREALKQFAYANPAVKDYDAVGGGQRPFNLNIIGDDQAELEKIGLAAVARMRKIGGLKDIDVNFRPGKPEFQAKPDLAKAQRLGTTVASIGSELRGQVEGVTPAKFRENGVEYDIRVRLRDDQRDIRAGFNDTVVPNVNGRLVRLKDVADPVEATGPSRITRVDRRRYVQIQADIAPGAGMGNIMDETAKIMREEFKLSPDRFQFVGQAENFQELATNMIIAMAAGVLFIFLVLSSLYESFVTPFTIMLALPLAMCGSLLALFLAHESLNIFSMIGVIMLLGVATKNSILLVDYAHQQIEKGFSRTEAVIMAGRTRLRPILMTTMALIAGTIPIALGLNEASRQRTSMGIAIIGGLISSTLLTLIVVPAAFSYVDRFRVWIAGILSRIFMSKENRLALEEERASERAGAAAVRGGEDRPDRLTPAKRAAGSDVHGK